MNKKPRMTTRKGTLQECVLVPITDPAEQAALLRRIREAEKRMAAANGNFRKPRTGQRK